MSKTQRKKLKLVPVLFHPCFSGKERGMIFLDSLTSSKHFWMFNVLSSFSLLAWEGKIFLERDFEFTSDGFFVNEWEAFVNWQEFVFIPLLSADAFIRVDKKKICDRWNLISCVLFMNRNVLLCIDFQPLQRFDKLKFDQFHFNFRKSFLILVNCSGVLMKEVLMEIVKMVIQTQPTRFRSFRFMSYRTGSPHPTQKLVLFLDACEFVLAYSDDVEILMYLWAFKNCLMFKWVSLPSHVKNTTSFTVWKRNVIKNNYENFNKASFNKFSLFV